MKVFLLGILISLPITAFAENGKTGLKPLTPKELRRQQKELGLRKIKKIKPNALGLSRINEERSQMGLSPISRSEEARMGKETEVDLEADEDFESLSGGADITVTDGFGGVLPASIDNSKLSSFPTIGTQAWNSCSAWAMGYYQFSHNNGLALSWVNNTTSKATTCSPKFIYNMINNGLDAGSYFADALNVLQKHGCVTWDKFPEDSNNRAWDLNPLHWKDAIHYRSMPFQYIYNIDTATGLSQVKQLLNNGYVLTFGTYVNSWVYTTIKANPNSTSNPLTGQKVMKYVNGTNGSHAMTVVGYDDNAWVDINSNNIVDSGELGVFKIANSWGTSWGHSGYIWVAYDALKTTSGVSGGPSSGRVPGFQSRLVYHQPVRAINGVPYKPKYLAQFKINHGSRKQMSLKFGWSTSSYTSPTSTYTPFALMNQGGAYAFNGTTTPVEATFVMDVSDLPFSSSNTNKFYFTMNDNSAGYAGTISDVQLIDVANGTQTAALIATPKTVDASSATVVLNYTSSIANQAPVAKLAASTLSGTAPLTVNFDGAGSSDPDGTIVSYRWNFGDGTTATGPYVTHTYSGSGNYSVTLTVTDDDGASATASTIITSSSNSTADIIKPAVTLTKPLSGSKYLPGITVSAAATASDNIGVTKVRFYANGYLKCTDYTAPYTCNFSMPFGTKIPVRARAYDAAGNYSVSGTSYISNF